VTWWENGYNRIEAGGENRLDKPKVRVGRERLV
jgi:hypothetical protein